MTTNMTEDMLYDLGDQYANGSRNEFTCPNCTYWMDKKWTEDGDVYYECSNCGMYASEDEIASYAPDEDDPDDAPEYCRLHCGGFDNYPACFDACGVMNGD